MGKGIEIINKTEVKEETLYNIIDTLIDRHKNECGYIEEKILFNNRELKFTIHLNYFKVKIIINYV